MINRNTYVWPHSKKCINSVCCNRNQWLTETPMCGHTAKNALTLCVVTGTNDWQKHLCVATQPWWCCSKCSHLSNKCSNSTHTNSPTRQYHTHLHICLKSHCFQQSVKKKLSSSMCKPRRQNREHRITKENIIQHLLFISNLTEITFTISLYLYKFKSFFCIWASLFPLSIPHRETEHFIYNRRTMDYCHEHQTSQFSAYVTWESLEKKIKK